MFSRAAKSVVKTLGQRNCHTSEDCLKVTVVGAAGEIQKTLSQLLKQNSKVDYLALYDAAPMSRTSHLSDTPCKVLTFQGGKHLYHAINTQAAELFDLLSTLPAPEKSSSKTYQLMPIAKNKLTSNVGISEQEAKTWSRIRPSTRVLGEMGPSAESKRSYTREDLQKLFPDLMSPVTGHVDLQGHQPSNRKQIKKRGARKHKRKRVRSFKKRKKALKQETNSSSATTSHRKKDASANGTKSLKAADQGRKKHRTVPGKKSKNLQDTVFRTNKRSHEGQRNWMVPAILTDKKPKLLYNFEDGKTKMKTKDFSKLKNLSQSVFQSTLKGTKRMRSRNKAVHLIQLNARDSVDPRKPIISKYQNGISRRKNCKKRRKEPVLRDSALLCKPAKMSKEKDKFELEELCSSGQCRSLLDSDVFREKKKKNSWDRMKSTKLIKRSSDLNRLCKSGKMSKEEHIQHATCKSQTEDFYPSEQHGPLLETYELEKKWMKDSFSRMKCTNLSTDPSKPVLTSSDLPGPLGDHALLSEPCDKFGHRWNKNGRNKNNRRKWNANPLEPRLSKLNLLYEPAKILREEDIQPENLSSSEQREPLLESYEFRAKWMGETFSKIQCTNLSTSPSEPVLTGLNRPGPLGDRVLLLKPADESEYEGDKHATNKNKGRKLTANPPGPEIRNWNLVCKPAKTMKDEDEDWSSLEQCDPDSEISIESRGNFSKSLDEKERSFHPKKNSINLKDEENTGFLGSCGSQSYQIEEYKNIISKRTHLIDQKQERSYSLLDLHGNMEIRNGLGFGVYNLQINCGRSRRGLGVDGCRESEEGEESEIPKEVNDCRKLKGDKCNKPKKDDKYKQKKKDNDCAEPKKKDICGKSKEKKRKKDEEMKKAEKECPGIKDIDKTKKKCTPVIRAPGCPPKIGTNKIDFSGSPNYFSRFRSQKIFSFPKPVEINERKSKNATALNVQPRVNTKLRVKMKMKAALIS